MNQTKISFSQALEELKSAKIVGAGPTRSGRGLQVRLRLGKRLACYTWSRTMAPVAVTTGFINDISYTLWKNLDPGPDGIATAGYAVGDIYRNDEISMKKLAREIFIRLKTLESSGKANKIKRLYNIEKARSVVRSNLIWALKQGLSKDTIKSLLEEAVVHEVVTA